MTVRSVFTRLLILTLLAVGISGCSPMGGGPADEEKDPFYLEGKSRVASLDRDGAIAAFENALISNPKSAAAHRELGFLYEEKGGFGAALYHFEKHLELRPESNMAETVKQHMFSCKLELARGVSFLLVSRQVQDEVRKLSTTNAALLEQVSLLKTQLVDQAAAYSNKLTIVMQASLAARAAVPAPLEPERRPRPAEKPSPVDSAMTYKAPPAGSRMTYKAPPAGSGMTYNAPSVGSGMTYKAPTVASIPTTHIVKSGETLASIARQYNLRLSSLQAANPGVDSRRMKAGQMIVLPKSRN
jgi:LysM repeat protein